jgi:hypothetical protein
VNSRQLPRDWPRNTPTFWPIPASQPSANLPLSNESGYQQSNQLRSIARPSLRFFVHPAAIRLIVSAAPASILPPVTPHV